MIGAIRAVGLALLVMIMLVVPADAFGQPAAQGEHVRIETPSGVVHAWRPPGYEHDTAGIVIYLHGYYTTADAAWEEHHLAEQFRASRQNALFLAPDCSTGNDDAVHFPSLRRMLTLVGQNEQIELPRGPVVAVAHSGGYRTMADWLGSPRMRTVVLLDAMYRRQDEFRAWIEASRQRRLVIISSTTARRAAELAGGLDYSVRRRGLPESYEGFSRRQRNARLLYIRSAMEHMEFIESGRVLPLLLRLSPLPSIE